MPIYEYECKKCGALNEVLQKLKDAPPKKCEKCGSRRKMERVMSRTSFVLKGSGWYITDYARKGKKGSDGESDSGGKSSGDQGSGEKGSSEKGSSGSDGKSKDAPKKGKGAKASAA